MKSYIKFGLISSVLGMIWVLMMYITEIERMDSYKYIAYISFLIPVICLYLGIKERRDKELNGFISYGVAFNSGLLQTLVSAGISTVFSFFYFRYINPGIIDFQIEKTIEKMQSQGMDEAQLEKTMEMLPVWMNPTAFTIFGFFAALIAGLVVTLIVSAILKNQDPNEIS